MQMLVKWMPRAWDSGIAGLGMGWESGVSALSLRRSQRHEKWSF